MLTLSVLHLAFWWLEITRYYLQDANGASAEALLSFSDSVLLLILPIAFGVLLFMFSLVLRLPSYRHFISSQVLEFT